MANKPKIGLSYFPLDTSLFTDDIRIRKLIKYQSGKAITVYVNLLCDIYKNGYYMKWDSEVPFMLSESTGLEEAFISEVIKCCLNIGLFSEKMFTEHKVLTSKGIQDRYTLICKQIKRNAIVTEYMVIDSEEMPNSTEEIPINTEEYPQSKVNKKKVKQIKPKEIIIPSENDFLIYAKENTGEDYPAYENSLKLKYKSWIANDWHNGNGAKIKNWKTAILNTIPYLKKENGTISSNNNNQNRTGESVNDRRAQVFTLANSAYERLANLPGENNTAGNSV